MGPMQFCFKAEFDPKVHTYLEHALGSSRLQRISAALATPALHTCLRVNTLKTNPQAVVQQLQQLFPSSSPYVHPRLDTAVILPGQRSSTFDLSAAGGREVVVNRLAGEAVLQGANVYAPGLLASTPGLAEGDLVAVTVAVEPRTGGWCGLNRGMRLTPELQAQLPDRQQLCVGMGRVTAGRRQLFKQQQGLAVEMVQRAFEVTPCNGVLPGEVLLQSLPCIVAAHALDPQPGSRLLDMCAAPGGKTTMLAQMMAGDSSSEILALDRTAAKAARVQQLADSWGVGGLVKVMAADATQLYQKDRSDMPVDLQEQQAETPSNDGVVDLQQRQQQQQETIDQDADSSDSNNRVRKKRRTDKGTEPQAAALLQQQQQQQLAELLAAAQPESFEAVLLDAPCSALGLRPRLLLDWKLPQLQALAAYQRALLHAAVHMLKPGGSLVYCTCTINPGENEANVRYALDKWPLKLVQQPLVLGGFGLSGDGWLTAAEAQLVQRFDPGAEGQGQDDTIGFFVAKFVKQRSTL